jgi:hypothetical protein
MKQFWRDFGSTKTIVKRLPLILYLAIWQQSEQIFWIAVFAAIHIGVNSLKQERTNESRSEAQK